MRKPTARGIRIRRYLREFPQASNTEIAEMVGGGCRAVVVHAVRMADAKSMTGAKKLLRESWTPPTVKVQASQPWSANCVTVSCASRVRKVGAKLCPPCHERAFPDQPIEDQLTRAAAYTNSLAGRTRKVYR
jgi:hypothetical protein